MVSIEFEVEGSSALMTKLRWLGLEVAMGIGVIFRFSGHFFAFS